ncbi:MAG: sensor histidine kinase [Dysgonomonas sp.]
MSKKLIHILFNPLNLDLNSLSLRFHDKDMETEFSADFKNKKLTLAILFTVLSALMFLSFLIIYDMDHPKWFVVMIFLSLVFGLTIHFKWISKIHYAALFAYSFIVELSYNQRILLYNATDTAGLAEYFLGLMLIVLAINSFIRLKFVLAILLNSTFLAAYVFLCVWGIGVHLLNPEFFTYSTTLFSSIITVVCISIYSNEYTHRNAFVKQKIIQRQADELRDAKDNFEQKVIERTMELEIERSKKLKAIIEGQQIERQRIAQDLHDSLNIRLVVLKRAVEPIFQKKHKALIADIDSIISQVHDISHNLLPYALRHYGLLKAIENLCLKIQHENKLDVSFSKIGIEEETHWDVVIETELFSIIQELATNCIKHAQANKLIIEIIANDKMLYITVADNGVGFDLNKVEHTKFGLNNIATRIQLLGGTISYDSQIAKGTTVMINIPVN